jgi:nucleoid DNA-binding protein
MTHSDLVKILALEAGITVVAAKKVLNGIVAEAISAMHVNGSFWWPGFGTFLRKKRKARTIRNPITKELMRLPECVGVTFRASKRAKAELDGTKRGVSRKKIKKAVAEVEARDIRNQLIEAVLGVG